MSTLLAPADPRPGLREPTARVNLLPAEVGRDVRTRRILKLTAAGVLAWVALLGLLFFAKSGQITDATIARDEAQAEVLALQERVARLEEYRELNARLEARNGLLAHAMTDEISWARMLGDLSLAFPANSSLRNLNATTTTSEAVEGGIDLGPAAATVQFEGYTVEEYAPGVESVLLQLDKVRAFNDAHVTSAGASELNGTEVTNFAGDIRLDEGVRTGRYAEGLPEEGDR